MKYQETFETLEGELGSAFKDTDTTFYREFKGVYDGLIAKDITPTEDLIREGLLLILEYYGQTKSKTKTGSWLRGAANFILKLFRGK